MQAAGERVHRVTIMQPVATQDAVGQPVVTWAAFARRWPCEVKELTGRELSQAQQLAQDITFQLTGPWLRGATGKMKCVWDDDGTERELHIVVPPINPDGRKRDMVLMSKEAK